MVLVASMCLPLGYVITNHHRLEELFEEATDERKIWAKIISMIIAIAVN